MERLAVKLYNWASILEDNTREQALQSSSMPFIFPHIALMPDAHLGMGATVGSVIPTWGAIMPAAVGVDIGCGMAAVRTQWMGDGLDQLTMNWAKKMHGGISSRVALGMGNYLGIPSPKWEERIEELRSMPGVAQAAALASRWPEQLGSLGGGNHFIEISLDEDDHVWAFLHSGSRGVGNRLAQKHIKIAKAQCAARWIQLPHDDLAYLVEGDKEFWDYIGALRWAQHFARLNRDEMMDRVLQALQEVTGRETVRTLEVNCHHNYTEQARLNNQTVWLSRKGAIDASEGKLGLIPGSMGAASYVVTGKGNRLALNSSPHGAGRNFSRTEARRQFTREDLDQRMEGIAWGESDDFLDEHPLAYKDIDVVMNDAKDLVEIVHTLRQVVNVKGS